MFDTKRIKISFRQNGDGLLECVGDRSFKCIGQVNRKYPEDLTVNGKLNEDKFRLRHSNEFGVDMPWAVLIWGQKGIFIHGWPGKATVAEYGNDTNGCIHLQSDDEVDDAKWVFDWVNGRTRVTITYPW